MAVHRSRVGLLDGQPDYCSPLTGYLVSKIDRLIELWFDPEHGPILLRPLVAHRILLCITSFLLSAVWTYVARKYFSFGPGSEQPKTK